ncbi:GMC oxidoreductase [Pseudomonadota bacterium]
MNLNIVSAEQAAQQKYELIIIGSGFGASFFLLEALKKINGNILVLEWGDYHSWNWQLSQGKNSAVDPADTFKNTAEKEWNCTIGFGGGMNCWFAQTPRFHPADFKTASLYGVGNDWPISYDDLEPYYCDVESIMSVSGDPDMQSMLPRSKPFPQPPHRPTAIDRIMKNANMDSHFIMPTARARVSTDTRAACCSNAKCNLCPIQAKFTVHNGFQQVYSDPRVHTCLNSEVRHMQHSDSAVSSVVFINNNQEYTVSADKFVLGANAIQSPAILLRSKMDFGDTGLGLHEQIGIKVEVYLDGLENFDGSTITTGLNYALYDGEFRKDHASCLIYFENRWPYGFRKEVGRWRETLPLVIVAEDLPQKSNNVTIDATTGQAVVSYTGESEYAKKGIEQALAQLPKVLDALPVEAIHFRGWRPTESHLQGTLRMGNIDDGSVVDANLIHHQYRNLFVVGTSVFPSCSCANPSLTAAALAVRAARMGV